MSTCFMIDSHIHVPHCGCVAAGVPDEWMGNTWSMFGFRPLVIIDSSVALIAITRSVRSWWTCDFPLMSSLGQNLSGILPSTWSWVSFYPVEVNSLWLCNLLASQSSDVFCKCMRLQSNIKAGSGSLFHCITQHYMIWLQQHHIGCMTNTSVFSENIIWSCNFFIYFFCGIRSSHVNRSLTNSQHVKPASRAGMAWHVWLHVKQSDLLM